MKGKVNLFVLERMTAEERARLMLRTESDLSGFLEPVRGIIEQVRDEGDAALARLGRELDGADLAPERLLATEAEFDAAFAKIEPEVRAAIEYAVDNIRCFHERQKPEPMWLMEIRSGAFAGERWTPIPSVACYVPRGKGAFPSVMMMTTIPAVVAGVREIAVLTPPTAEGGVDAASLVAARLAGVERVYKAGGALAVAAAALAPLPSRAAPRSWARAALGWSRPRSCSRTASTPACPPDPARPSSWRTRLPRPPSSRSTS
jgi:histidinol dehydrogenase